VARSDQEILARVFNQVSTLRFIRSLSAGTAGSPATIIDCPRKHSSKMRAEHRLEAYATLAFRTVEQPLRAIPGAIAVHPR
jgi:hypothetical protein